jgi:hypothetical protein
VFLRNVLPTGRAEGSPVKISETEVATGGVDLRWGELAGGAVFVSQTSDTITKLRFRRFDRTLASGSSLVAFSMTDLGGQAPALAPYRGGLAVLWRAYSSIRRQLRFAVIDFDGQNLFETQLMGLVDPGGVVDVARTLDGKLLAVFGDHGPTGTRLVGAPIRCEP